MKTLRTSILALLVFPTCLIAQSRPSTGTGTLTGTIICDDTHGPARRASVHLESPVSSRPGAFWANGEFFTATTGMDGSFTMSNVPPGEYYVIAMQPGYVSARDYVFPGALSPELTGSSASMPSFVQRITIVPGESVNVTIQLKRGASISGTVSYSDTTPVPYVALMPKMKLANGEFAEPIGMGANHTDASGHYRIDGLPEGSYVVLGGMEGRMVPVLGGQRGGSGLIILAGGVMRPSKARVVSVKGSNDYPGVDITIPLVGVHEVSGTVTGPDGHRLNQGLVRLYPTGEPHFNLANPVEVDGTFRFHGIPPDSYTILLDDAADPVLTVKDDGVLSYEVKTDKQKHRPVSKVDINVADADLTDVKLVATPVR